MVFVDHGHVFLCLFRRNCIKKIGHDIRFRALNLSVSRYNGILWLSAAMLFVTAGILFALQFGWWWMFCFLGTNISQYLIIKYWSAAKFGTIANVIILVFSAFGFIIWVNLG